MSDNECGTTMAHNIRFLLARSNSRAMLLILALACWVVIASAEAAHGPTTTGPDEAITPTPGPAITPAARLPAPGQPNTDPTARGFYALTASFYSGTHLWPFEFESPYTQPFDVYLSCQGQVAPWAACKLDSRQSSGGVYSVRWTGSLVVPRGGSYTINLEQVDDGARVLIDGVLIVDKGWNYPQQDTKGPMKKVRLAAGIHRAEVDYEQRAYYVVALRLVWWGPDLAQEVIPVHSAGEAFTLTTLRAVPESGGAWTEDTIAYSTLTVEADGTGVIPPTEVVAVANAQTTLKSWPFWLDYVSTVNGVHTYRAILSVSDLVVHQTELTASGVVYDEDPIDYATVLGAFDNLQLPQAHRLGISRFRGEGSGDLRIPPASVDYMKAAGFERVTVTVNDPRIVSQTAPLFVFVKNQGKVFFYLGHGLHDDNYLFTHTGHFTPTTMGANWTGIEISMLYGCSVLEIGDFNNWWYQDPAICTNGHVGPSTQPGKDWLREAGPDGPDIWLGFQDSAPYVSAGGQDAIWTWANQYRAGVDPSQAWELATENHSFFRAAVAIDKIGDTYWYWNEYCYFGQQLCRTTREPLGKFCVDHVADYVWTGRVLPEVLAGQQWVDVLLVPSADVVQIQLADGRGRRVGREPDGGTRLDIPGATYEVPKLAGVVDDSRIVARGEVAGARHITVPNGDIENTYSVRLAGCGEGTFNLHLEIPERDKGLMHRLSFIGVTIKSGMEYYLVIRRTAAFILQTPSGGGVAPTAYWTTPISAATSSGK